jgi:hypothetical protein
MTYLEYKSIKKNYNDILDQLSKKLNSFPKSPYGGVSEESRKKPEFIQLQKSYDYTFKQYQNFNSLKDSKKYAKEFSKEKRQKKD